MISPSVRPAIAAVAVALVLLNGACGSDPDGSPDAVPSSARAIVDSAVAAHGGDVMNRAVMTFDFRGAAFRLVHDGGRFRYTRTYTDSLGRAVREVLSNDSLYRAVDGTRVDLSDDEARQIETAVNSVAYFALLPEPLSDPAVQPARLGRDTINGTPYHVIEVTFRQEGGGRDWEDRFVYWFRTDTYAMDYLAYAYGLGSGGEDPGHRFREAYDVRRVNGVRVADYRNYTDTTLTPSTLERYPSRLNTETLELVSTVDLDSVRVRRLEGDES
jgi:hypothetical protein